MSSLPKGENMGTKLVELLANRVVERRNMINDYLRGRACIESVRGVDFRGNVDFELFLLFSSFCLALSLFLLFVCFCGFPSTRRPS
jgi:hypothetical protein